MKNQRLMWWLSLPALAALSVMGAAYWNLRDRPFVCPAIADVDRANIWIHKPSGPDEECVIGDPAQLQQIVTFANLRRNAARPRFYTMPAPQQNAVFYEGQRFVGGIGVGSNFFFVSCPGDSGIRKAKEGERQQFFRMIQVQRKPERNTTN